MPRYSTLPPAKLPLYMLDSPIQQERPMQIAVLAFEGCLGSAVFGTVDMLTLSRRMIAKRGEEELYHVSVVSFDGGSVEDGNGGDCRSTRASRLSANAPRSLFRAIFATAGRPFQRLQRSEPPRPGSGKDTPRELSSAAPATAYSCWERRGCWTASVARRHGGVTTS